MKGGLLVLYIPSRLPSGWEIRQFQFIYFTPIPWSTSVPSDSYEPGNRSVTYYIYIYSFHCCQPEFRTSVLRIVHLLPSLKASCLRTIYNLSLQYTPQLPRQGSRISCITRLKRRTSTQQLIKARPTIATITLTSVILVAEKD